jgi:plastocyanin
LRTLILFLIPLSLLVAEQKAPAQKRAAKKPASAAAAALPAIPAGAEEIEPMLYRFKDKSGRVWLYRKTPFGITKMDEQQYNEIAKAQAGAAAFESKVHAVDNGDTVRFERATPMGKQSWEKKKSDLTSEEKAWLEQSVAAAAPKPEK